MTASPSRMIIQNDRRILWPVPTMPSSGGGH